MAKPIILAALFVALVATASATTTYTTTVTTTVIDNPTGTSGEQCRQQIQPRQQLKHCMMYLSSSPGRSSMRFAITNVQEQHLNECCQQLTTNIDKSCRCKAIQEIVREQQKQEQGQMHKEEMQQEARRLPSRCGLQMPQECQISVVHIN